MASRKQCQKAALLRGIIFDGVKSCRNPQRGRCYEIMMPNGNIFRCTNLTEAYNVIMIFPKLKKSENQIYRMYIRGELSI